MPPNVQKTCARGAPLAIPSPGDAALGESASAALITDVNEDGRADLVVIAGAFIDVYLGGPTGLAASLAPQGLGADVVPERAYAANVDGNGTRDLVLEARDSRRWRVSRDEEGSRFDGETRLRAFAVGYGRYEMKRPSEIRSGASIM